MGIEIGFSASYAIFVHENMQQKLKGKPRASGKGVYWGPRGRPKFLEIAMNEMKDEVVQIAGSDRTIGELLGRDTITTNLGGEK